MKKKTKAKGKSGRWLQTELAWRSHHGESFDPTDSLEEVILKSMDYPGASLLDAKGFSLIVAKHIRQWLRVGGDVKPGGRVEERKEGESYTHAGVNLHEMVNSTTSEYKIGGNGRNAPKMRS